MKIKKYSAIFENTHWLLMDINQFSYILEDVGLSVATKFDYVYEDDADYKVLVSIFYYKNDGITLVDTSFKNSNKALLPIYDEFCEYVDRLFEELSKYKITSTLVEININYYILLKLNIKNKTIFDYRRGSFIDNIEIFFK